MTEERTREMTTIEQKARDMVHEVLRESELPREPTPITREYWEALCRAIEQHEAFKQKAADTEQQLIDAMQSGIARAEAQHEAFKQKVSDALVWYFDSKESCVSDALRDFIIPAPKPDPLVEIIGEINDGPYVETKAEYADRIRAALEARGLEIRGKNDGEV